MKTEQALEAWNKGKLIGQQQPASQRYQGWRNVFDAGRDFLRRGDAARGTASAGSLRSVQKFIV
ncbi:hypothetical protein M3I54_29775 [Paraburkholderia sp. CNPSo 3274]|uniref:hypothetical protein n=1 Tax=Paraburkholderia sp. CNPSo 3274 TaxID=2940932 RepID=UPI0020B6C5EF|nr:hypothetical protein [Paraburkholderia sp. CNPSo 3274]MCP3711117.1 hypothetical protein [Paraburkholderia sp. CNPSo 3274]